MNMNNSIWLGWCLSVLNMGCIQSGIGCASDIQAYRLFFFVCNKKIGAMIWFLFIMFIPIFRVREQFSSTDASSIWVLCKWFLPSSFIPLSAVIWNECIFAHIYSFPCVFRTLFSPSFYILMYLLLLRFQFSFSFRMIFKWNGALYMHIYNINHKQRRIKCVFYFKLKQPLKIFHINKLSCCRTFQLRIFVKQFDHQFELKCNCRMRKRAWELWYA